MDVRAVSKDIMAPTTPALNPDPSIETGALFLDIDKVCDLASEWPHMMPPAQVVLPSLGTRLSRDMD